MLNELLERCKGEWQRALSQKKHPYRFFVLGTTSDSRPELRTVVLRDYNPESMEFTIYTDARSSKVSSLNNNEAVEILFYNPEKLTQVRIQAQCVLKERDDTLFREQALASQKDYTTVLAPGSRIDSVSSTSFLQEEHHFMKLVFQASQLDYLELRRPVHIRALFKKVKESWIGEFRTP